MQEEMKDKLKGFIRHGFVLKGISGNNAFGTCPFSGEDKKFYINTENLLWDSKTENLHGNFLQFLDHISKRNRTNLDAAKLHKLAVQRKLPVEAFKGFGIGHWGTDYTIPVYGTTGKPRDIRVYRLGKRVMSTPTCQTGIFNLPALIKSKKDVPVYLCEGEWDAIALNWLLRKLNKKGVVVGIPGANTFKKEWIYFFNKRHCIVMYDNDVAGEDGEHQVIAKIKTSSASLKFLHWPEKYPNAYDIRDFIVLEAIDNKRPNRCFKQLQEMLKEFPRKEFSAAIVTDTEKRPLPPVDATMTWDKLCLTVQKWLRIKNLNSFMVTTAVVLSNYIDGDPVWLFLVACPGEGKSETLGTLKYCPDVYTTSSLTPNSLISGAAPVKGRDPSLLPKLDKKTLCIKDFSAIQAMRDNDRDALLGILRDAYDGSAGKDFGTGEHKHFESKFSMLAGTTPSIYELDAQLSALGERFLKFFIGEYLEHRAQIDTILRAQKNVGSETGMREEMANAMFSFIENTKKFIADKAYKPCILTDESELNIAYLAAWCSRIKGTVSRDRYERDVIINKAYTEVGTRTGKQLKRILLCFPSIIYNGKEEAEDINVLKKIALDTVSAKREDIFRTIFLNCKTRQDSVDVKILCDVTRYSYSTVLRILDDLIALGIVERVGTRKPFQYQISEVMYEYTQSAGLYQDNLTRNRISRAITMGKIRTKQNGKSIRSNNSGKQKK